MAIMSLLSRRVRKEIAKFAAEGDEDGLKLISPAFDDPKKDVAAAADDELLKWQVQLAAPESSVYAGEVYLLDVSLTAKYPFAPPVVRFRVDDGVDDGNGNGNGGNGNGGVSWKAPKHEHVYSNGVICMSLLSRDGSHRNGGNSGGGDWCPAMTVHKLLLAVQSMLSSASSQRLPDDDDQFVEEYGPRAEKWKNDDDDVWDYHDGKC